MAKETRRACLSRAALLEHLRQNREESREVFDMEHRALFLRFNTDDPSERQAALAVLREVLR